MSDGEKVEILPVKSGYKNIKAVEFIACFPQTSRAIDTHGAGGSRIMLDIPENFKPQVNAMSENFLGIPLRVIVASAEDNG